MSARGTEDTSSSNHPSSFLLFEGLPLGPQDEILKSFHHLMIGERQGLYSDCSLRIVERSLFSLDVLLSCWKRCGGTGLACELRPYMIDLLKRQQSLNAMTDSKELEEGSDEVTLAAVVDEVADEYFEYRQKELLISLLEVTSVESHSRLCSLVSQIGCSMPFVYRYIASNGRVATRFAIDCYDDLLCHHSYSLILSCGTICSIGQGKSDLLSRLFEVRCVKGGFLELYPGGPCHNLSIDLAFNAILAGTSADSFILADTHGSHESSLGFNSALSVLASESAVTLVHVNRNDFTSDGLLGSDIQRLLSYLTFEYQSKKAACFLILWRDFVTADSEIFEAAAKQLELLSNEYHVSICLESVVDIRGLKGLSARRTVTRLGKLISKQLSDLYGKNVPVLDSGLSLKAKLQELNPSKFSNAAVDVCIPASFGKQKIKELVQIQSVLHHELTAAFEPLRLGNSLFRCLFPASSLDADIAQQEEQAGKIVKEADAFDEIAEARLAETTVKLTNAKLRKRNCKTSELVKWFAQLVARNNIAAINEFRRQIEAWKVPKCEPLLAERRVCHEKYEVRLAKLQEVGIDELSDQQLTIIKSDLMKNAAKLDQFDISIDDFWSELMSLAAVWMQDQNGRNCCLLEKECLLMPGRLSDVYRQCLMDGHPMQLLRGHPLYMASDFISSVMRSIQENSTKQLFVVSVIGIQSSAKSTLLNYLFGCGFATRAGRCTRGLYASYVETNDLDILVLDSEGLMSVEAGSGGKDFDNQVTLMAMACSHVVIINHKGELSRELQDLLEVALFAMKNLEVAKLQPDISVVLRDQADLDHDTLTGQLINMRKNLNEKAEKLQLQVSTFFNLNPDSMHLLPPAYETVKASAKDMKVPTKIFSDEVLRLRQKLFQLQSSRLHRTAILIEEFSSLQQWLIHARSVWKTIRLYGINLLQYGNMQEIEQRKEISALYSHVADSVIDHPDNGFQASCQQLLKRFVDCYRPEDMDDGVTRQFQTELDGLAHDAEQKAFAKFNAAVEPGGYTMQLTREFTNSLRSRVLEVYQMTLRAWKKREELSRDRLNAVRLKKDLIEALYRVFNDRRHKKAMTQEELDVEFEVMWNDFISDARDRIEKTMLREGDLLRKINGLMSIEIHTRHGEAIFAVLNPPMGPLPDARSVLVDKPEDEWQDYLRVKMALKKKMQNLLQSSLEEAKQELSRKAAFAAKQEVVTFFSNVASEFAEEEDKQTWDSAGMGYLMNKANTMVQTIETTLESRFDVKLRVPDFANAVHDCLRYKLYYLYREKQHKEVQEKIDALNMTKDDVRISALSRLTDMQNDVGRAEGLARDVFGDLVDWSRDRTLQYSLRARTEIKRHMSDPASAAWHAYEESFLKCDWSAVVRYCNNAQSFLKELFDDRFAKIEADIRLHELKQMKTQVERNLDKFCQLVNWWGEQPLEGEDHSLSTNDLKQYALSQIGESDVSTLDPNFISFLRNPIEVRKPCDFASAFVAHVYDNVQKNFFYKLMDDFLQSAVRSIKHEQWDKVRGCSEVCPCCNAKCIQPASHLPQLKHRCAYHILPAFHGSRYVDSCAPIIDPCTTACVQRMTWKRRQDDISQQKRSMRDFFEAYYPNWTMPDLLPPSPDIIHLRKAWVNCRKPYLRKFNMDDNTSQFWDELYLQEDALR